MNRFAGISALALCLCIVLYPPQARAKDESRPTLQAQFDRFLAWFPGRYDSALQARIDEREGVPEAQRNYRRHSIFRRVALPAFGEIVFYAEQYRDGDPLKVYRQRFYVFTLDHERTAIRLRVHVPDDVTALRGAYRDPSLLSGLTPEDTTVWPGCDLWWTWEGTSFRGALDPGACRFTSEAFGQEIVLDEYLILDESSIQFADRGLALDGSYLFGMRGEVPNLSRKVRPFLCVLSHGATRQEAWIHDQGGQIAVSQGALRLQRWDAAGHAKNLQLEWLAGGEGGLARRAQPTPLPTVTSAQIEIREPVDATRIRLESEGMAVDCRYAPGEVYNDRR